MKTILVLTDFSAGAEHAAKYAVRLARKIKADVLLCHGFMVPEDSPMLANVAWSVEDYASLKEGSDLQLEKLVRKLKREISNAGGRFYPDVTYRNVTGKVAEIVEEMVQEQKIVLTVMGTHGASPAIRFFLGSRVREVLDLATCPVLIIPEQAVYRDFTDVAFATDLSSSDLEAIQSLGSLCEYFGAEISLVYVSRGRETDRAQPERVREFLTEVSSKIDYPKIYYRNIKNNRVKSGLYWLSRHSPCDLFVTVHRKHGFVERTIKGSITQQLADKIKIPLLVFPFPAASLPVF